MAEELKLKSRAVEIYDFRQVDISDYITGFTVDESQLQKDLERVLRRFGRKEPAQRVSEGDTATLTCRSAAARYNKTGVTVLVGKGLFSRELEGQLVGMEQGETKTLTADGEDVTVEISRITHTALPALTDENVASFGMEGVSTVADLRRYCIGRQVEAFLLEDENPDFASAFVWQEVAKHSRIDRDPNECARASERAEEKMREAAADGSAEVDLEMFRNIFLTELDLAVIGADLMGREGKILTTGDYEKYIDKQVEAYPNRTRADLEREKSKETFAISRYADYLATAIDAYVTEAFKKALVK